MTDRQRKGKSVRERKLGGGGGGGAKERATEAKQGNDETKIQRGKY